MLQPGLKPPALDFIGPSEIGKLPLVLQFLLAEIGVDLMRLASVHTPTPLATAMSLIAAILIGDIAVKTGLFINEVILYMAVAAIGMFATPSYELGLANRIVRLLLIISVAVLHVPGFVLMSTFVFIVLVMERSFNRPYMWPLIPFDARGMWNIILRTPVLYSHIRPNLLRPQQMDKVPTKKIVVKMQMFFKIIYFAFGSLSVILFTSINLGCKWKTEGILYVPAWNK